MGNRIKAGLVIASILTNILLGYFMLKTYAYNVGYIAGQTNISNEVNAMIQNGQLVIPQPNDKEITD